MHRFFKTLLVAGTIGSAAMLSATGPVAAGEANVLFRTLQESGADTTYVQRRGGRLGGFRGGFRGRGIAGRGLAGRGFAGRRGLAGRGFYGRRGYGGRGYYGRGRHGYGGYGYRRRGIGAGAAIGGLAAGALIGGALAAQAAPAPDYGASGGNDAYCSQKFKSYDPASGTYLGYDGKRHPCP